MKIEFVIVVLIALSLALTGWFKYRDSVPERDKIVSESVSIIFKEKVALQLRSIADIEQAIGESLYNNASDVVGFKLDELDNVQRELLISLEKQQKLAAIDIRKLKQQLEVHLESNQDKELEMILSEMNETKPIIQFEEIQKNLFKVSAFHAINSTLTWSNRLREWADLLDQ